MSTRRILLVDDNADDRALVRRYLQRSKGHSYEIIEASSGEDALAQVASGPPDVVILDQHLGGMTGNELLAALRSRGHEDIAAIVLTGSEPGFEDPLELGADDFLNKEEINGTYLRRAVDNAIIKARFRHKLERSEARLREALEEVTQRMEFERRLMGVVSHDLRSPLQSVHMGMKLLEQETALSTRGQRTVGLVSRSVEHMSCMIGQLLDVTRTRRSGGYPVTRSEIDLCELVRLRVEELRAAHPDREITYTCEDDGNGLYDPTAIGQLVHNLVGNALRHGRTDGPVEILASCHPDRTELRITNFGAAIPADVQATIFEPFSRGRSSSEGLGLGLYISHQITLAHGGRIDITSDDERTVFRVELPRV